MWEIVLLNQLLKSIPYYKRTSTLLHGIILMIYLERIECNSKYNLKIMRNKYMKDLEKLHQLRKSS